LPGGRMSEHKPG